MMKLSLVHVATFLCGTICITPSTFAQRKPDAPPLVREEATRESLVPQSFVELYQKAASPRLLIFSYLISVDATQSEGLNELGIAHMFNARLRTHFTHPAITLINMPITDLHSKAEFHELAMHDHLGAAQLLGRESGADVVVLILLTELTDRADGAKYACSYNLVDVNRNHRIGQHSWEMSADPPGSDMDVKRLEKYAGALASRIYDDFRIYYPSTENGEMARKFTVQIHGVPSKHAVSLRDAIRILPRIPANTRVEYEGSSRSIMEMDLTWTDDPIVLADAVSKTAAEILQRQVVFTVSRQGLIVLKATSRELSPTETSLSGGSGTPESPELRRQFEAAYSSAGSPSIAVMINRDIYWTPSQSQTIVRGDHNSGSVVKVYVESVVNEADHPHSHDDSQLALSDEELLNRREMEDRLMGRLRTLGVTVKDLQQALRLLAKDHDFAEGVWDDLHLARVLGENARADIVISGIGRVQRKDSEVSLQYTFRAYDVHTAEVLATATVYDDTLGSGGTDLHALTDQLAAAATGRLSAQLMNSWSNESQQDPEE